MEKTGPCVTALTVAPDTSAVATREAGGLPSPQTNTVRLAANPQAQTTVPHFAQEFMMPIVYTYETIDVPYIRSLCHFVTQVRSRPRDMLCSARCRGRCDRPTGESPRASMAAGGVCPRGAGLALAERV